MKAIFFAVVLAVLSAALALGATAKPLTKADLIQLLKNEVSPSRVAALATNKGIDFEVTTGVEEELRQAGADTDLIEALRKLAPKPASQVLPAAPQVLSSPQISQPAPRPERTVTSGAGRVRSNPRDGRRYVWIPPGNFLMGCSPGDKECADDEKPAHRVSLIKGFWMSQTAVTVGAWKRYRVATRTAPLPTELYGVKGLNETGQDTMPAVAMTWDEAKSFCEWSSLRLPTEAEWEYAARAGTTSARYADLDSIAWYRSNSGPALHTTGAKQPNAWKLYDMLGNVWQWTADRYNATYDLQSEKDDPASPSSGEYVVLRGGSWSNPSQFIRVSVRARSARGMRFSNYGFRCVGELP